MEHLECGTADCNPQQHQRREDAAASTAPFPRVRAAAASHGDAPANEGGARVSAAARVAVSVVVGGDEGGGERGDGGTQLGRPGRSRSAAEACERARKHDERARQRRERDATAKHAHLRRRAAHTQHTQSKAQPVGALTLTEKFADGEATGAGSSKGEAARARAAERAHLERLPPSVAGAPKKIATLILAEKATRSAPFGTSTCAGRPGERQRRCQASACVRACAPGAPALRR